MKCPQALNRYQIDYINVFKSHNHDNVVGNYHILEVSTSTTEACELEVRDNRGNPYSCFLRMAVILGWSINMTQEKYPFNNWVFFQVQRE